MSAKIFRSFLLLVIVFSGMTAKADTGQLYNNVIAPLIAKCPEFLSGDAQIRVIAPNYNIVQRGVYAYSAECYEPERNGRSARVMADHHTKEEGGPDGDDEDDGCRQEKGSIILPTTRALGEEIQLVGAPFSLYYFSDKVQGRASQRQMRIPVFDLNPNVTGLRVQSTYAGGRVINENFSNVANEYFNFEWDGKDANNDVVNGAIPFHFNLILLAHGKEIVFEYNNFLGYLKNDTFGFGLWVPSIYHFYDTTLNKLIRANGTSRMVDAKVISGGNLMVAEQDVSEVYIFDSTGRHLFTKYPLTGENKYEFVYDGGGRLSEIRQPHGQNVLFSISDGKIQQILGPKGHVTQLSYDANGQLKKLTHPDGGSHTMTYYEGGLLRTFKKPGGQMNSFYYDDKGKLTLDAHSSGSYMKVFEEAPEFHSRNIVLETRMGSQQHYQVSNGLQVQKEIAVFEGGGSGGKNHYTRRQQNSFSRFWEGYRFSASYKPDPRFPESGQYSGYEQLAIQNTGAATFKNKTATLTSSDPFSVSNIVETTNKKGKISVSTYSGSERKWSTVSAEGRTSVIALDEYEKPTSLQVGTYAPVLMTYASDGNLSRTQQAQRSTRYGYDSLGYVNSITNALMQTTHFENDSRGRVLKTILPDQREIQYEYDANGNLLGVTPPNKPQHSFLLTAFETIRAYLPPALGGNPVKTQYFYDLDNRLTKVVRPDAQEILYHYEGINEDRVTRMTTPNGPYHFQYDWVSGAVTSATSPYYIVTERVMRGPFVSKELQRNTSMHHFGEVRWDYDDEHRLKRTHHQSDAGDRFSYSYTYDKDDLVIKKGWMNYQRDSVGAIQSLNMDNAKIRYEYDSTYGEMSKLEFFQFGSRDLFREYKRDLLGRVNFERQNGEVGDYFVYDKSGRFVARQPVGERPATEEYEYDSNGNRIKSRTPAGEVAATYDDQDRLLTWGDNTYTYNHNGDLSTKINTSASETTSYTYDTFGNLRDVILPNSDYINYGADGFNRRVYRMKNWSVTHRYLYENQLRIAAVLNENNELQQSFIYENHVNVPDYMVYNGERYIFVKDIRGSVLRVVNSRHGDVVQEMEYDSWGRVVRDTNPGFQPFGFAGGLYDPDTGLVRFGARDYDAETGRWLSKDPIGFAGGDSNLYGYALRDPINYNDFTGRAATRWNNRAGGRSPLADGPTNGNWGGKNWSGRLGPGQQGPPAPPTDSADACYQAHDYCYGAADDVGANQCPLKTKQQCDAELKQCLSILGDDMSKWPKPPPSGTEGQTRGYKRMAEIYF